MATIYFSLTFSDLDGSNPINTYSDWQVVPSSRPLVNPPEVRTEYVDIPGADGSLDYTEVLNGIKYKNREGSWTFYVLNELFEQFRSYRPWSERYTQIMKDIHGRRKRLEMESDPGFYYTGRFFVDQWQSNKDYSQITIKYNIDPYKRPTYTSRLCDWQWSELFNNEIYYGQFEVKGSKRRNIINFGIHDTYADVHLSQPMTIVWNGVTTSFPAGVTNSQTKKLPLKPGDNYLDFVGTGFVILDYDLGARL